ncbi:hypothetical protein FQN57_000481 [Myotisia sp. PD_48]|nr:hypothetical protein FQN57_000481 [Myotisia sp. PD_48]
MAEETRLHPHQIGQPIKYIPFESPRHVGWLMGNLFMDYSTYQPDSFTFEWLCRTEDLEVVCRDSTREPVDLTSDALLKAIHNCKIISTPEPELPSDWGFSGFIGGAVATVERELPQLKTKL